MRARRALPTTVTLVVAVMLVGLTAAPVGAVEDEVDALADELICTFEGVGTATWNSDDVSFVAPAVVFATYGCDRDRWFVFSVHSHLGLAFCEEGEPDGGSIRIQGTSNSCGAPSLGWTALPPEPGGPCTLSVHGINFDPYVEVGAEAVGWCPMDWT